MRALNDFELSLLQKLALQIGKKAVIARSRSPKKAQQYIRCYDHARIYKFAIFSNPSPQGYTTLDESTLTILRSYSTVHLCWCIGTYAYKRGVEDLASLCLVYAWLGLDAKLLSEALDHGLYANNYFSHGVKYAEGSYPTVSWPGIIESPLYLHKPKSGALATIDYYAW